MDFDALRELKSDLNHIVTRYDRKQENKKCYNHYALGIYMIAVDNAINDIDNGAKTIDAINNRFNDRLLAFILKNLDIKD